MSRHSEKRDPYDTSWMTELERYDVSQSAENLITAFNDLETIVDEYGGMTRRNYSLSYPDFARMCADCTIIYNECERLLDRFGGRLDNELYDYLRHLRIACAHYSGSSTNDFGYYDAVEHAVLPMKEKIRSMLYDVIKRNGEYGMSERVHSFNRKHRFLFGRR